MARRATALGLACAAAASLAAAPQALGHARLTASGPAGGAGSVELDFDEPVDDRLSSATLSGRDGRPERLLLWAHPQPGRLVFALPRDAMADQVVVSYRVLATDGHVTAGVLRPRGRGAAAGHAAAATRQRAAGAPAAAQRVLAAARALQYAALAIVLGAVAFVLLAWLPAAACLPAAERPPLQRGLAQRWRRPANLATAVGVGSAAIAFGAQVAVASGSPGLGHAGVVLDTRAGTAWLLALAAWLTTAAVLAATRARPDHPRALVALGLPLALLAVVPASSGHAGRDPGLALVNVVHVCAISVWLGGLVALALALRVIRARRPGPAGAAILRALTERFSVLALAAIAALVLTGSAQSALLLGGAADLVQTSYGRLILVKIAVTAAVLALGARQRHAIARSVVPAESITRAELLLGVLALATTAVLAGEASHG